MKLFDLNGKVAIVTGGYGHLGSAITQALLEYNSSVIVAGRSEEKFEAAFDTLANKKLHFRHINILDSDSVKQCIEGVKNDFGSVDILINNAHSAQGQDPEKITDAEWSHTMEGVLGSIQRCIKTVIPIMKRQESGKIINISSMYGVVSPDPVLYEGDNCEQYRNPPHYGAAKAGVIQLTKYYANWLGRNNIQVNAITPGPFPKKEIQEKNPVFIERLKEKTALKKIGKQEDMKGVSILLSSNASDFITGQNFIVDGGWTSK